MDIMVKIFLRDYSQIELNNSLLVIGLYEDNNDFSYLKEIHSIDSLYNKINEIMDTLSETIKKFGKNLLFLFKDNNDNFIKILFIGLGKYNELDNNKIRQIGGIISLKARDLRSENIVISNFYNISNNNLQSIIEGLSLSLYEFNKYRTNMDITPNFFDSCNISLIVSKDANQSEFERIIKNTLIVTE